MKDSKRLIKAVVRVGSALGLLVGLGAAAAPSAQAWGSWGSWANSGSYGSCTASLVAFTGQSGTVTDAAQRFWAMDPHNYCEEETQAQAYPSLATVTSWNTTQTAYATSPTNVTKTRCRAQYIIC